MTNSFRLYRRRSGVYYAEDVETRRQESLKTQDKATAVQLLNAKNAATQQPSLNLAVARVHLAAHDPQMVTRTWQRAMDEYCTHGRDSTQDRSLRAFKSPPFDAIRNQPIVDTTPEVFLNMMRNRGPALIHYLRRLHNLELNLGWLPWPVLHKAAWPKPQFGGKRAITETEYRTILSSEQNEERRAYYEVLWEIGASQMDAARLAAENVDWISMTMSYNRMKLREDSEPCVLRIGPRLAALLRIRPQSGPLFPNLIRIGSKERAAEFRRRCGVLGIKGVTLHSF